jgi:hypothetical protein
MTSPANSTKRFVDLGSGYYESHINQNRQTRDYVRELQALSYKVTPEPAAAADRCRVIFTDSTGRKCSGVCCGVHRLVPVAVELVAGLVALEAPDLLVADLDALLVGD